jgi:hypothetical protein
MKSEEVILSAPMSLSDSAERIIRNSDNIWIKLFILVPLIAVAWIIILMWYAFFGILIVPYRLIRRSQRKQKRDKLRHNELLEALAQRNAN